MRQALIWIRNDLRGLHPIKLFFRGSGTEPTFPQKAAIAFDQPRGHLVEENMKRISMRSHRAISLNGLACLTRFIASRGER